MTDESAGAHRHSGRYLALCGVQVLAASLAAPERGAMRKVRDVVGLMTIPSARDAAAADVEQLQRVPAGSGDGR